MEKHFPSNKRKLYDIALLALSCHPIGSLNLILKFGVWQLWLVKHQMVVFVRANLKC